MDEKYKDRLLLWLAYRLREAMGEDREYKKVKPADVWDSMELAIYDIELMMGKAEIPYAVKDANWQNGSKCVEWLEDSELFTGEVLSDLLEKLK